MDWPWVEMAMEWTGHWMGWLWVRLTMDGTRHWIDWLLDGLAMGRTDHGMEYFSSPLTLGIGVTGVPEQSQNQSPFSVQMVPPFCTNGCSFRVNPKNLQPFLGKESAYRLFSYKFLFSSRVTSLSPANTQPYLLSQQWQFHGQP